MIIGVTGPICAGKDEIGKIFAKKGFERLSLVEELRDEARRRGIEITRESLQDLGDKIRKEKGADALAKKVAMKVSHGKNYVIESIRNPGEVGELKKLKSFFLLCITASDVIRFARMVERGREQDPKTFDDFLKVEARDRGIGQAMHGQQNEACWKMATVTIVNDSTLEELDKKLESVLASIQKGLNIS